MQKPLDVHLKAKAYAHPFFMFALWKKLLQFFVSVALLSTPLIKWAMTLVVPSPVLIGSSSCSASMCGKRLLLEKCSLNFRVTVNSVSCSEQHKT